EVWLGPDQDQQVALGARQWHRIEGNFGILERPASTIGRPRRKRPSHGEVVASRRVEHGRSRRGGIAEQEPHGKGRRATSSAPPAKPGEEHWPTKAAWRLAQNELHRQSLPRYHLSPDELPRAAGA